jgi:hopanoid biosynthesis associated protein HpnK
MQPRSLIMTADDFGHHPHINEAIERAARAGTLSCASLMVGAPAFADAVTRALRMPELRVGLHLTLVDGFSILPHGKIPLLVDAAGRFRSDMVRYGFRIFADPRFRRQLRDEIRAQFEAYLSSGLKLDHVDTHKHFHLHPNLLDLILEVGPAYGMRAMRLPDEPFSFVRRQARGAALGNLALKPLLRRMRARLAAADMRHNDQMYGMAWTGAMTLERMLAVIDALPSGVSEMYFHPATSAGADLSEGMRGYRNTEELNALLSKVLAARLAANKLKPCGYGDLR